MATVDFKLYLIGDRHQTVGRPLNEVIQSAAEAGIAAFQFREKDLSLRAQFELAKQVQNITKQYGMKLLINDRIDLCIALDANGVHLPSSGFPVNVARNLLGQQKLIAVSCHSEKEVKQAQALGADFAVLGPVFDTPSKRHYGPPLSLKSFHQIKQKTQMPLFAIGGINLSRINAVFSSGADGVALISAISTATDIHNTCRQFLQKINQVSTQTTS